METKKLYPPQVNEFRQNRLAIDIIAIVLSVEEEIQSGDVPIAVSVDVKSAFDPGYHAAILASIIALGLAYSWIPNYLEGQKLMCTAGGPTSYYEIN